MSGLIALLRPPNVFTAFADALAGLVILLALGLGVPDRACAILLASGALYLSGIVLNDVFDREIDARERPTRPIPSGAVSVVTATVLGAMLMVAGVAIAWWIGRAPGMLATLLAVCILLYDGGMKATKLGPLVMGSCRGLDLALGLSTGLPLTSRWPLVAIAGPVVLAVYVTGLTYIARDEVDGNTTRRARTGLALLALLAIGVVIGLAIAPALPASRWAWGWVVFALALGWRNWSPLWHRHDARSTGRAIGGGIVLIPVIDATVCAVAGAPFWAFSVALLVFPALILKQFFSPT